MDDPDFEAALDVLGGRQLLEIVATCLASAGIPVVALKGVVLSALAERLVPAPPVRPMRDLDVLVPGAQRRRAEDALGRDGFIVVARTRIATTLRHPAHALDVDLHEALCEPELFRIDLPALFARTVAAEDLLGVRVRVLAPLDAYAHLVVHFVRGRSNAWDVRHVTDFATLARAQPLAATDQARHLDALGLGRAARYVLDLAGRTGDAHATAVRAALAPDPAGDVAARLAGRWLARRAGRSPAAVPALHLLNDRASRGARSLLAHVRHGLGSAARRVLERP